MQSAAPKHKIKKAGSIRRTLVWLVLFLAAVYLLSTLVSGQIQLAEMQKQLDVLVSDTARQSELNVELQKLSDSGDMDAYVQRVAREKLDYVFPNERIFIDMTGQ